jgi:hypothetical protein
VPLSTLQSLNPGLKRGMTPQAGPHRLLVPLGTGHKLRKAWQDPANSHHRGGQFASASRR